MSADQAAVVAELTAELVGIALAGCVLAFALVRALDAAVWHLLRKPGPGRHRPHTEAVDGVVPVQELLDPFDPAGADRRAEASRVFDDAMTQLGYALPPIDLPSMTVRPRTPAGVS